MPTTRSTVAADPKKAPARKTATKKAPARKRAAKKAPAKKAPAKKPPAVDLKLSPEVEWYLQSRGIPMPDCPPLIKTPEPRNVPGAKFDAARVDRVLAAFEILRHTQGALAGRPLRPDPWQVAYIIAPIFGWVRKNEFGRWARIITNVYIDIPRKNGKSTLVGGLGIYLCAADGEMGAQVLAAATTRDQAQFVFAPIKQLAASAPGLKGRVRPLTNRIVHQASGSYFAPVSNIADAQHGGNIHGALIDELHVHKNPEMVDVLSTGTGSREQPLVFKITTADSGAPDSVYDRERRYVERLAKRTIKDASRYGVVWAAEAGDDPFAESTWKKANPGYGISPTKRYLEEAATTAKNSPAELAKFLRLHLGLRTKQETRYITLEAWDGSAGSVDEDDLVDRTCHGGIDLSQVEDITALCWTFPDDDGGFDAIWRFWLPEERLPDMSRRTAGAADVWVRDGWLELTAGNVIDNDAIFTRVMADAERFNVATIGYDRYGATDLVRRLGDEGLTVTPVGQGTATLSAPTKELLRLLLSKKYRHGGNPVMRWMIDNLAVVENSAGDVKPAKNKSAEKIDGVSAAVTALREHMDAEAVEELPEIGYYGSG